MFVIVAIDFSNHLQAAGVPLCLADYTRFVRPGGLLKTLTTACFSFETRWYGKHT